MFYSQLLTSKKFLTLRRTYSDMIEIFYYTFVDSSMHDYLSINSNFIELTHKYQYFVLVSGQKDGQLYVDYLKTILGPKTIYIHSDKNAMTYKFNLFRKYLEEHHAVYCSGVFCKIDVDLIHYNVSKFHEKLMALFSADQNLHVGIPNNIWLDGKDKKLIRGGLNAVHYKSIMRCGPLPEDYRPFEFDAVFSDYLAQTNITHFYLETFVESPTADSTVFATHIVKGSKGSKKDGAVKKLLQSMLEQNIKI